MYRLILPSFLLLVSLAATSCAKRSRATLNARPISQANDTPGPSTNQRININTAPATQLETLPGIGKGIAEGIVEHRAKYGPFRRAEHLMMVRGISETRFRALRNLITVE
jgi:competence protein ComEA